MKTKLLFLTLVSAAFGGSLFAQNPTAVTGTILDPNSVPYYPAQVTACLTPSTFDPTVGGKHVNNNIGANYCVGPVSTAVDGSFALGLFANANITPAATQWIFTVTAVGAAPPAGKGAQFFSTAAVTVSGASQSVTSSFTGLPALLNAGSSSSASSALTFTLGLTGVNGCTPGVLMACINGNAHTVSDATSNSTTLVTCPNNDCNFTGTDFLGRPNMVVGQKFWATTQGSSLSGVIGINTTFICATTTVASFTAQTVTLNAACGLSGTANVMIYWGSPDGATLNSVMAKNCLAYTGPSGVVILTDQAFGSTLPACATGGFVNSTGNPLPGWVHPDSATVYVMSPDFNWATCGATACFGAGFADIVNVVIHGTGLTSAANVNCANGNNKTILTGAVNGNAMKFVDIAGICPGASGMIGVKMTQPDSQLVNGGAQDVGVIACEVTGQAVYSVDNDCHNADVVGNDGSVNGLVITSSGALTDINSFVMSQVSVAGQYSSRGTHFVRGQNAANAAVYVENGGVWVTNSDFDGVDTFIGKPALGVQVNAGGLVQASNTKHGASSSAGAGVFLNGGTFQSLGGNSWVTGIPSQLGSVNGGVYTGTGVLSGTAQGTCTSSATLVLYGIGQNSSLLCTSAAVSPAISGYLVQNVPLSGSVAQLFVQAGTGCKSGNTCVFTVMKTHLGSTSATTITCSMVGPAAACEDATHTDVPVLGDVYSVQFTTGATETLANVTATLLAW